MNDDHIKRSDLAPVSVLATNNAVCPLDPSALRGGSASECEPGWGYSNVYRRTPHPTSLRSATLPTLSRGRDKRGTLLAMTNGAKPASFPASGRRSDRTDSVN